MPLLLPFILAAAGSASATPVDPIALAKSGRFACVNADSAAKTCTASTVYTPDKAKSVKVVKRTPVSTDPAVIAVVELDGTVENGAICATVTAPNVAKIWLAESWPDVEIPYRSPLGESLLARLRAAYTEKLVGKRLCDRFSGDGPNQTMQTTVDGAASNSFSVQWVDMKAGYVTQQRRVR